jgi:hypothetical protein
MENPEQIADQEIPESLWKWYLRRLSGLRDNDSTLVQVTVNLTLRSAAAMELAAGIAGDSRTDTINRALQVYAYFERLISEGGEIHVREPGGSDLERLTFP